MNDFIRLMFDDGANRPAIESSPWHSFTINGHTYRWRRMETSELPVESGVLDGTHLYSEAGPAGSDLNILNFAKDPATPLLKNWGLGRSRTAVPRSYVRQSEFADGTLCFVALEKVS